MRKSSVKLVNGDLFDELSVDYDGGWLSYKITLDRSDSSMSFNWRAGPIPVDDFVGKEIIAQICQPVIKNNGTFFTDSNGRQLMRRQINQRPTYDIGDEEPVSQNYYPITSLIMIKDGDEQMVLVTDRAQGGTSLSDGCVEIMLHRRLLFDDKFGVGEALNEESFGEGLVAVGSIDIHIGRDSTIWKRKHAKEKYYQPFVTFHKNTDELTVPQLGVQLPEEIHILTLKKVSDTDGHKMILRLEHIYGLGKLTQHDV